jgi:hypothetical protein
MLCLLLTLFTLFSVSSEVFRVKLEKKSNEEFISGILAKAKKTGKESIHN